MVQLFLVTNVAVKLARYCVLLLHSGLGLVLGTAHGHQLFILPAFTALATDFECRFLVGSLVAWL